MSHTELDSLSKVSILNFEDEKNKPTYKWIFFTKSDQPYFLIERLIKKCWLRWDDLRVQNLKLEGGGACLSLQRMEERGGGGGDWKRKNLTSYGKWQKNYNNIEKL